MEEQLEGARLPFAQADGRPLIAGFLKVRNEVVREGNLARCLANLRLFCDTIVACDDASVDGTREVLQQEIPLDRLLLVDPDDQDFCNELAVKQEMLSIVDRLRPRWIWWADADEELPVSAHAWLRELCDRHKDDTVVDGYRFKYLQVWRTEHYYRTDAGFADGNFVKLWKWSPNMRFRSDYGTHHQQFPEQIKLDRVGQASHSVIHWGNYGTNLRWKAIQYHGGLGGVDRHLDFETGTFAPMPSRFDPEPPATLVEEGPVQQKLISLRPPGVGYASWLGGQAMMVAQADKPISFEQLLGVKAPKLKHPLPKPFTAHEKARILALRGLRREPAMFTVIIPTYNRGWALPETLGSLLKQSYQRWVAFVLDDGSTDETPELMKEWQERDQRIFYARYPKLGAVAINELGMNMACDFTQWWTRLGSDDYFEPHKLSLDALALAAGHEWTYGAYRVLRDGVLAETCNVPTNNPDPQAHLLKGGFCVSWANTAASCALLQRVRARHGRFASTKLTNMEDFLVNVRMARFARPVFRALIGGRMIVLDPNETDLTAEMVKRLQHDAIWRVSTDGASSNTVQTGNEDALTQELIAEDAATWGGVENAHFLVTPPGTERRASGEMLCDECGEPYRKHKHTADRDWNGEPWLRKLCNGDVVKL